MEIARNWRLQHTRYGLIGEICPQGHKIFPPRDLCPDCNKEAKKPYKFSGKGEVYSFTTVYDAPKGFMGPYVVALIKLEEGPMITAQITDADAKDIEVGMPVEMVTRKISEDGPRGIIHYGYKFRPPVARE